MLFRHLYPKSLINRGFYSLNNPTRFPTIFDGKTGWGIEWGKGTPFGSPNIFWNTSTNFY